MPPVLGPAIADSDDLHAWLIRGFVEAGLPDHTRGGREWIASGALNLENYIEGQGADGVLLQFRCPAGDQPGPEDDYTYSVQVARGPEGTQVVVRSVETLFHHAFPAQPANQIAGHILEQVRAHNEVFTAWRSKGGEVTYAQRLGIPEVRGSSCDRQLAVVLETLRRANRSVTEGPANKWWVSNKPAASLKIEAGLGQEPVYRTRKEMVTLTAEDLEHAARLRTAGLMLLISGGLSVGFVLFTLAFTGYNVWQVGFRGLMSQWWTLVGFVGGTTFASLHMFAGFRLRSLRSRGLVQILAILGMLPCFTPCCFVGFPVGGWVVYLMRDERTQKVFAS